MGVRGVPDAIREYGDKFRGLPKTELPSEWLPGPDGPLSAGLAGAHNLKSVAAVDFARAKDQGTVVAADGLVHIATNLADIDRQGAEALGRLLPLPPERQV